jgi:hypothetical protein
VISAEGDRPLVWPVEMWPDIDRMLWLEGMDFSDPFVCSQAKGLAAATVNNARKAYGRFLAVLGEAGGLQQDSRPADRLTRVTATLFLRSLFACKNSHNSVTARIQGLYCAMRIMEPKLDWRWLIDRQGMLTIDRRDIIVYDGGDLEAWGHDLMACAQASLDPAFRQVWYRNGLMITIYATSAPRLRAIGNMQLGKHIRRMSSGAWELWFNTSDVKNRRIMEYALPERLWPCVDRYVEHERKELLDGRACDHFWVGRLGERLGVRGIEGMIRRASKDKFGQAFGPHRFRHSLATTQARIAPYNPGLAASLLGISEGVLAEHYNKARNILTFERFQAGVQAARQQIGPPIEEPDDDDLVNHLLGLDDASQSEVSLGEPDSLSDSA